MEQLLWHRDAFLLMEFDLWSLFQQKWTQSDIKKFLKTTHRHKWFRRRQMGFRTMPQSTRADLWKPGLNAKIFKFFRLTINKSWSEPHWESVGVIFLDAYVAMESNIPCPSNYGRHLDEWHNTDLLSCQSFILSMRTRIFHLIRNNYSSRKY